MKSDSNWKSRIGLGRSEAVVCMRFSRQMIDWQYSRTVDSKSPLVRIGHLAETSSVLEEE